MNRNLILLGVLIALYFGVGFTLHVIYGDSYPFLAGEDYWAPDYKGGWIKNGNPTEPMPEGPSENVPMAAPFLPFLIPGFVLILFLFTPLRHKLEKPLPKEDSSQDSPDKID